MSKPSAEWPRRCNVDNSASYTDNASAWCLASDKPFPSSDIAAQVVRLPARPSERIKHNAVVLLLAQTTRVPPVPSRILHLVVQIVRHSLRDQNLRLLRQTRHMCKSCRSTTRASAHEALLFFSVEGLCADVACLALGVVRALLDRDRDRDRLLVLFVRVVLFRVAAAVYFLADLLVPAAPVVVLAGGIAVPGLAPHTPRRVVGQWGGARGAVCNDHAGLAVCCLRGSPR